MGDAIGQGTSALNAPISPSADRSAGLLQWQAGVLFSVTGRKSALWSLPVCMPAARFYL